MFNESIYVGSWKITNLIMDSISINLSPVKIVKIPGSRVL